MAKKDKRISKESGHWKPGLWDTPKVCRFMRHVTRYAALDVILILGGEDGKKVAHEIITGHVNRQSELMLAHLGVKTIGDLQRGA
jgi:hypothetical protein